MSSVLEIKEAAEKKIIQLDGVSGVGIGRNSPEKIHVYLKTACHKCLEKIPAEIGGVPVDIIITGKITTLNQMPTATSLSRRAKYRPCPGGVSISHKNVTAGTFGTLCYDNNTQQPYILSNNHVLSNEASVQKQGGMIGDTIVQPGTIDGGTVANDTIATLEKTSILDMNGENEFDCAIAKPLSIDDISSTILDQGVITQIGTPDIGDIVTKSGRSTGLTESKIVDVNATIKVSYSSLGELTFRNQTIIYPGFAAGGDSGSIIIRKRDGVAVGLLFAGSDTISIANKMTGVADIMNINLGGGTVPPLAETVPSTTSWVPVAVLGSLGFIYMKNRGKK